MDLYLIRHTRTQAEAGVCYGRLDVPLAPTHADECAAVIDRLPAAQVLWSSPLARCRVLAGAIGERLGIAPKIDARLCELDFGEWEGRRWDAIDRDQSERWSADYWNLAPPGGESYRDLHARVDAALEEMLARNARQVAVVTHAGPIRALLSRCLPRSLPHGQPIMDTRHYPELNLDYGGISLMRACRADGHLERIDWHLEYLNG
jgi:alpha-ribazole phosphatase